jgi:transposase InsO family protein
VDLPVNAVLTVRQRQRVCELVAAGVMITAAARVVGCSRQTASKRVNRRRRGESLGDRSSRPHRSRTPELVEKAILRARGELRQGPHLIGWAVGFAAVLERWAYAYPYQHESQRQAALPQALNSYNRFRPHRALAGLTPLQRVNNLPGTYT